MAIDKHDPLAHHLVRRGDGLFRVARIVSDFEDELFAENPAFGVDVLDSHARAADICSPIAAFEPVMGPTTAILISPPWRCMTGAPAAARATPPQ